MKFPAQKHHPDSMQYASSVRNNSEKYVTSDKIVRDIRPYTHIVMQMLMLLVVILYFTVKISSRR